MDILIKGIPDGIGEQQFREWCGIIVERFENAKLNQIKEVVAATEAAKEGIDTFREANALAPKFRKVEEVKVEEKPVEEVVAPKEEGGIEEAVIRG